MYALFVGLICDLYGSILDSYGINMVLYVIYMGYGIYIGFIRDVYWNHIGLLYGLIDRQVTWDSEGPWSHIPPKKKRPFQHRITGIGSSYISSFEG